jgi:hypothetical protein
VGRVADDDPEDLVPRDNVMSSIEMFGRHVIPEMKKQGTAGRLRVW